MKWLNCEKMRLLLFGIVIVIVLSVVNARGAYFQDNFDRPDGEVGNGWKIWREGNLDIKIEDNELVIAGQQGTSWKRSGIYRPVEGETRFSFDFKADDNLTVHIELWDNETNRWVDFYAWPGGRICYYKNGNVEIPGSPQITNQYNNLVVEQDGTDYTLTLNGQVIGTYTKDNIVNINEVFICADARAGTVGSLHIDNVVIGQPPIFDFNGDGIVDSTDMCIMVDHWGEDYSLCDIGPTLSGDGIIDVQDLIVLAEHLFDDYRALAQWKLDEKEGDIAYDSVGGHDGILYGEPIWQPTGGQVVGALELDGIDDYISTPFVLNPKDGSFSAFMWIKGGGPDQVVISQTGDLGQMWLGVDPSGKLVTRFSEMYFGALVSETVITDSQWHHVGFIYDMDTFHRLLYVDGVLVAEDATVVAFDSSDGGMHIGAPKDLDAGTFFSGLIDDVRIYNQALTAEEIAALAH